jgi:hypothetical protein
MAFEVALQTWIARLAEVDNAATRANERRPRSVGHARARSPLPPLQEANDEGAGSQRSRIEGVTMERDDDDVRWMQELGQEQEATYLAALDRCRQAGAKAEDIQALAAGLGLAYKPPRDTATIPLF